jgi:hypothetical protein
MMKGAMRMIILAGAGTSAPAGPAASAWVNKYGVSEDGTTHALTGTIYGLDNNGAGTSDFIPVAGGSVKTTAVLNTTTKGFGLDISNSHIGRGSRDADIFLLLGSSGTTELQINFGYGAAPFFPYANGDELKIHISDDRIIECLVNSVLKKCEGTLAPDANLYGMCAIETVGAVVNPLIFGPVEAGSPPANAVTWANKLLCGVGLSNVLVGLAGGYYSGSLAGTTQTLVAGVGGSAFRKVSALGGESMFGLSNVSAPVGPGPNEIKYGFNVYGGTNGQIWEGGTDVLGFTVAGSNDLEVRVSSTGVVTYYHNTVLKRTSGTTATFPLYGYAKFGSAGGRIEGARMV